MGARARADDTAARERAILVALRALDDVERVLADGSLVEEGAAAPRAEALALQQRVDELSRTVEAQDEFLSTLGHELRNPLAPLLLQAQYLVDTIQSGDVARLSPGWLVPQLEGFCRRFAKFLETLERIMDVSRLSAGQLKLELDELDLTEVVRDVVSRVDRELVAARSELILNLPVHYKGVWDRLRIEQIVANLLQNAIRYGAGKPIRVSLSHDDQHVELTVADEGIGIDEADQERIFERFARVGKKRHSGGFGIGLWTVQQSCRALGGHVSVRSRLGEGAQFVVVLPRVSEEEQKS